MYFAGRASLSVHRHGQAHRQAADQPVPAGPSADLRGPGARAASGTTGIGGARPIPGGTAGSAHGGERAAAGALDKRDRYSGLRVGLEEFFHDRPIGDDRRLLIEEANRHFTSGGRLIEFEFQCLNLGSDQVADGFKGRVVLGQVIIPIHDGGDWIAQFHRRLELIFLGTALLV